MEENKEIDAARPKGRWLGFLWRRSTATFVLGGTLLAFAPQLISASGMTAPLARAIALPAGTHLTIGRVDLAWWRPIHIHNVTFATKDESLRVEFEEGTSSQPLALLAWDHAQFGAITITRPNVKATLPSNDAPAAAPAEGADLSTVEERSWWRSFQGELRTVGGTIEVVDSLGASWKLAGVEGSLKFAPGDGARMELAGHLAEAETSTIQALGHVQPSFAAGGADLVTGDLRAEDFPLEMLNPILVWLGDESRIGGRLSGTAHFDYEAAGKLIVETDLRTRHFVLSTPSLDPDRLTLDQLDARLDTQVETNSIRITQGNLSCDLGQLTGQGELDWDKTSEGAPPSMDITGTLDLPALARELPGTIRVRDDVIIDSGKLAIEVRPVEGRAGWLDGTCEVRDLRARCKGEPIEWPRPVVLAARAGHEQVKGWTFEEFRCDSDFLRAKGSGSVENLDVTAVCDLGRLQDRLGELLDLGDTRLAGRFTGRVQSQRTESDGLALRGAAKGEGITIRSAGQTFLAEPLLNVQFQASTRTTDLTTVQSGALVIKNETEQLNAHLRQPPEDWEKGPWGTWDIQASGDLAEIRRRLEPISDLVVGWQIEGLGVFSSQVTLAEGQTEFRDLVADVQNFVLVSSERRIADPRVRLTTSGRFNADQMALDLETTAFLAEAAQIRTDRLRGKVTDDGIALACQADVAADLARIRSWTLPKGSASDLAGQFVGKTKIESDGRRWLTTVDGTVNDARYGAGPEPILNEPTIQVSGQAGTDFGAEGTSLREARLSVPGLSITATGSLRGAGEETVLQLDGLADYDLETLAPRLRTLLGDQVALRGRDRRTFHLEGSIDAAGAPVQFTASDPSAEKVATGRFPKLRGNASFGWEKAQLYGFSAGSADFQTSLADSWLVTKPTEIPLSGGALLLRPGLFFGTQATYLHHPAGTLAKNVRVTPEMCAGALQYIAPVLARSVEVAGDFSLDVGEVKVPLGAMDAAEFQGRLLLNDVRASGSPLVQELLVLTEGQPLVEIAKGSAVDFRVANGRVYHENLQVRIPGATVRTSGSVGFDQSLELIVETPIPKKWLANNQKIAQLLGSEMIKVPIGGTLEKPRLDRAGLERQVGQLISRGTGRAMEGEINKQIDKQLDRLFDKLR